MRPTPEISIGDLVARYQGILLDAYGVLNNAAGPLEGAVALIDRLNRDRKPYLVVTNDASRLPETSARRFRKFGLAIDADRIVTSGSLLAAYFAEHGLAGARCVVLGTEDSRAYVRGAGGEVIEAEPDARCDAVVVCDDSGYPFVDTMDATLSALVRACDRGDDVRLILPNPDLVYPKGDGAFGYTSGAAALLFESALARLYPRRGLRFDRLGKPHARVFARAVDLIGTRDLVMIGDQLETDIAGARAFGLDAALLTTGVTRWDEAEVVPELAPCYLLRSLC